MLAEKLVQVFPYTGVKNSNEFFGQPNPCWKYCSPKGNTFKSMGIYWASWCKKTSAGKVWWIRGQIQCGVPAGETGQKKIFNVEPFLVWGFPGGSDGKEAACFAEDWVGSLGWEDPLEKGMATHSSILAWRIPWTEKPGGLQSMGLQRIGHDWVTNTSLNFWLNMTPCIPTESH